MDASEASTFLRNEVSFLGDCPDEKLAQLAAGVRILSVEPEEAVSHWGDEASFLGNSSLAVYPACAQYYLLGQTIGPNGGMIL